METWIKYHEGKVDINFKRNEEYKKFIPLHYSKYESAIVHDERLDGRLTTKVYFNLLGYRPIKRIQFAGFTIFILEKI